MAVAQETMQEPKPFSRLWLSLTPTSAWVSGHIQIAREGVAFGQKVGTESQDSSLKLPQLFLGL